MELPRAPLTGSQRRKVNGGERRKLRDVSSRERLSNNDGIADRPIDARMSSAGRRTFSRVAISVALLSSQAAIQHQWSVAGDRGKQIPQSGCTCKSSFEMIEEIIKSTKAEQILVRHVFGFWVVRSETMVAARLLREVHRE